MLFQPARFHLSGFRCMAQVLFGDNAASSIPSRKTGRNTHSIDQCANRRSLPCDARCNKCRTVLGVSLDPGLAVKIMGQLKRTDSESYR